MLQYLCYTVRLNVHADDSGTAGSQVAIEEKHRDCRAAVMAQIEHRQHTLWSLSGWQCHCHDIGRILELFSWITGLTPLV